MDESEREVNSKTPGVLEIDGKTGRVSEGERHAEPPRLGSAVALEIREDPSEGGIGKNIQKGEPRVSLKNFDTPTTDRQRLFAKTFLTNGRNKVKAFLKATPSARRDKKTKGTIDVKADKMFKSAGVQFLLARAEDYKAVSVQPVYEKYAITEARIAEELAKIAFSDPTQVMSWGPGGVKVKSSDELAEGVSGTIAEVSGNEKTGVKIKQHDKLAALLKLGEKIGMFEKENTGGGNKVAVQFIINKGD